MVTDYYHSGPTYRLASSQFPLLIHRNAVPEGGKDAMR